MKRPTLDEMKAQPAMFEGLPPNLKLRPGARPCSALADNGKTCNDCRFAVAVQYAKRYHKCKLNEKNWTCGTGSDIRLKDPACAMFEEEEAK